MDSQPEALPRRTLLKGAVALGGVTLLTACGSDDTSAAALVVTDQGGKKVSLDGRARRIVTLPFPAPAMLIAVDGTADHLVGVHNQSWVAAQDSILGEMFPDVLDLPHEIGTDTFAPNVESILKLEPDLVIQYSDKGDEITAPLTNAGLTVLGVSYGTLDDANAWFRMFSAVLGKPERGQAMVTRLDSARAEAAAIAERRTGEAPRVLYFLRFAEGLRVAGRPTANDEYIRLIGAENVASDIKGGFGDVDLEQVLQWDPEVVLLGTFDAAVPADIYGDKRWKDVAAVKSKRVYKVPLGGYRWDPPSHESPLMWTWLSQVAFPDGTDGGLREKIVDDYKYFYGHTPTPSEIDTMLWTEANGGSADYDQFSA